MRDLVPSLNAFEIKSDIRFWKFFKVVKSQCKRVAIGPDHIHFPCCGIEIFAHSNVAVWPYVFNRSRRRVSFCVMVF